MDFQDRAVMFGSCGELTLRVICCLAGGSSGMAGEGLSSAVRVTGTTLPPQMQRPLWVGRARALEFLFAQSVELLAQVLESEPPVTTPWTAPGQLGRRQR